MKEEFDTGRKKMTEESGTGPPVNNPVVIAARRGYLLGVVIGLLIVTAPALDAPLWLRVLGVLVGAIPWMLVGVIIGAWQRDHAKKQVD
jgi:hypothetical protein